MLNINLAGIRRGRLRHTLHNFLVFCRQMNMSTNAVEADLMSSIKLNKVRDVFQINGVKVDEKCTLLACCET